MYRISTALALTLSLLFSAGKPFTNASPSSVNELKGNVVQPTTNVVASDNKMSTQEHRQNIKSKRAEMNEKRDIKKIEIPASITKTSDAYLESIQKQSNANLKGLNLKTPGSSNYKTDKNPVPFKSSSSKKLNLPASLQLEGYEQTVSKSVDSQWNAPQARSQNNQVIPQELNSKIYGSQRPKGTSKLIQKRTGSFDRAQQSNASKRSELRNASKQIVGSTSRIDTPRDIIERDLRPVLNGTRQLPEGFRYSTQRNSNRSDAPMDVSNDDSDAHSLTPAPQVIDGPPVSHNIVPGNRDHEIVYSRFFETGVSYSETDSNWIAWEEFVDALHPDNEYYSVTISGSYDTIGYTISDPEIAAEIASALHNREEAEWVVDDIRWAICNWSNEQQEFWVDSPQLCSGSNCPSPGYIIRPKIGSGNPNWGGVGTSTCGGPDQVMTLAFDTDGNDDITLNPITTLGFVGNKVYGISDVAETWDGAHDQIDALAALYEYFDLDIDVHLVTITSQEEQNLIYQGMMDSTSYTRGMIGFTDQELEGDWRWVTDEEPVYTNWNGGEPNNAGGNEHVALINRDAGGSWDDANGVNEWHYVVELTVQEPEDENFLEGHVVDAATGNTITGAHVDIYDQFGSEFVGSTDEEGFYNVPLPSGCDECEYEVYIYIDGWFWAHDFFSSGELVYGEGQDYYLGDWDNYAQVNGLVFDGETSEPLPYGYAELYSEGAVDGYQGIGFASEFAFTLEPLDSTYIVFYRDGYEPVSVDLYDLAASSEYGLEVFMYPEDGDGLDLDNTYSLVGEDSSKVYIVADEPTDWYVAHEQIDQLRALYDYFDIDAEVHMVTIHSQEENDLIYQGLMDSSEAQQVFIGLTDEVEEGNWEWVTGEDLTYTNWEAGEGEGGDGENFAVLSLLRNAWQDHGEGATFSYVVEITFDIEDDEEDHGEGLFSITFDDGTTASYDLHLDSLIEEDGFLFYNVHEATITLSDGTVIEASSECRDHGAGRVTWDGYMLTSVVYDSVCNSFAFDAMEPNVDMIEFMSHGGDVDFTTAMYYGSWSGGTSASASLDFESHDEGDLVDCACEAEYFVGDRVVLTVDNPDGNANLPAGTEGTVFCGGETPFDLPLLIQWDLDDSGHENVAFCDCGRDSTDVEGLNNNAWWVSCDQVELIEEEDDENYLSNGSFEDATMQENEWQYLPNDWEGYPHQNSQTVVFTGETMYNTEDTFEAFDGNGSLKIWGLYEEGENTENNVFQTWYDGELEPGTRFNVEAALMSHNADFIGQGGNSVILFAKYFTSDWGYLGMDASSSFDAGSIEADMWYWWGVSAEVPEGATTVQVGAMLIQPTGDDHGSAYLDSFWMWETDDDEEPGDFVHLGEFEGHHYYASPEQINGSQYPNFVQELQNNSDSGLVIYPVTISSANENMFLSEQIMSLDSVLPMSDYWIGLTDQWSEGDWMWYNGEEVTYTNWSDGEPNGGESENYAMLWPENYQWNDGGDWELPFIIELEFDGFEGPRQIIVDGTNGNDFEGDGSFDYPYSTISKAVSESQSGGSVLVAPGVYSEDILVEGLDDFNIYSMEGPDYTTIQGNDNDTTALAIHFSGHVGVWGFTFVNSVGYSGGAIDVLNTEHVQLFNNRFYENHALWYGGAVATVNSGLDMHDCHFSDNISEGDGGGLFIMQQDSLSYSYANIYNTNFENNIAADEGAGMFVVNPSDDGWNLDLNLDNVGFYNNSGARNTGLRANGPMYLGMYRVNFMNNHAENYAAGMGLGNGVQAWSDYGSFINNTANESGGNNNSGGVSVWSNSSCNFYFNTFVNNSAAYGSHITAGGGGSVDMTGCIIWGYSGENGIAAVQWDEVGSYVHVSESDVWNGDASCYSDDYSQVDYVYETNINLDPFFCTPEENWFAVDELSPAVTSWGEIMGAFGAGCSGTVPGEAMILSVQDVPDDQGGRVYVTFEKSLFDTDGLSRTEMYTVERLDGDDWVGLTSIGAYASNVYVVEATTLSDSTSEGNAETTFRVIANMDEGNFDSEPSEGFSVDNIAPDMLTGLQANMSDGIVILSWEGSEANDFSHYAIYYSTDAEFEPSEETMIGTHSSPSFEHDVTEIGDHYYIVSAFDVNENEGDHSESVNVTLLNLVDVHGLPEVFALHQNYPNPFNPTTTLRYDLPEDSYVSIVIFDMMGRQVRTLKNGQASAGYHSMMWNATNDIGSHVSAGVYIYTIQAGDYRDVRKMILLK